MTKALGYGPGDIWPENKQTEPPLYQIAKSYVDKLTRMTPDERQKLRHSLQNYMLVDVDLTLTPKKKESITNTKTNKDSFQDRLRFFKVWSKQIRNSNPKPDISKYPKVFDKNTDAKLQQISLINPTKAYQKLDKYLAVLKKFDSKL